MNVLTFSNTYRKRWNYSDGLGHPQGPWKQSRKHKKTHKQSKGWMGFNFLILVRKATKWNYSVGLWHPKGPWKQSRKHKKAHKHSKCWMSFNFLILARKATKWNYSVGHNPKGSWKQSRKHQAAHKQSKHMLKTCAFNFLRLIQVNVLTFSHTYRKNLQKKIWWSRASQRPWKQSRKHKKTHKRSKELLFRGSVVWRPDPVWHRNWSFWWTCFPKDLTICSGYFWALVF